ncbi:MAG: DUF5329 family protein [Archangium sp.]|nr:DUF5329 family protein [Archangium sp.]
MQLVRTSMLAVLVVASACEKSSEKKAPVKLSPQGEVSALLIAFETSGASLERNGEVLDNQKAATWLRSKASKRAAMVHGAEDFIEHVADHSSQTKTPYTVVLKDGTRVGANAWFRARLAELRPPP